MGAAASGHNGGVARHELHLFRRNAEAISQHLREGGLMALPARLGAGDRFDLTARMDRQANIFARMSDRALHIVRNADACELAALPRLAAACRESLPIG